MDTNLNALQRMQAPMERLALVDGTRHGHRGHQAHPVRIGLAVRPSPSGTPGDLQASFGNPSDLVLVERINALDLLPRLRARV